MADDVFLPLKKYTSCFAPLIEAFIAYRKVSENWRGITYEPNLLLFDSYCQERYPDADAPLQEMIDSWCEQRDTESNNSCRTRINAVAAMIRYSQARDNTNLTPPVGPRTERSTYIPHAFTDEELTNFFDACDNLTSMAMPVSRSRKITVPVFFRLLYSSGIRTTEARLLRVADVDLNRGILDIQLSKGYAQHYIALHDSMSELLRKYDAAIRTIYPSRIYFFPASESLCHTSQWVERNFRECWSKDNKAYAVPYELRHHYATSNINNWVENGFGFDAQLLYLSKSMGHSVIESTKYYYSLVPSLAGVLEEKTNAEFEAVVPEMKYEEIH
jgi:integrase